MNHHKIINLPNALSTARILLTPAGLRNAKRKGKRLGRPPVSPMTIEKARKLRVEGLSYRKIGKRLGISEGMVRKGLKEMV